MPILTFSLEEESVQEWGGEEGKERALAALAKALPPLST